MRTTKGSMKVLGVRQFKSRFSHLLNDDDEIYITSHGEPVAIFIPLLGKKREEVRKDIARELIGLGKATRGRTSEDHDEVLYS